MPTGPTTRVVVEPLNLSDKVSYTWRFPLLGIRCVAYFASKCLSSGEISSLNWRQKLVLAYLQATRDSLTEKQLAVNSRLPLTGPRIQVYCRKQNLEHRSVYLNGVTLDNGRNIPNPVLHFITVPSGKPGGPTILYSHGGGYHRAIQAQGHIPFVLLCGASCGARQIVFLEYSLSPEEQYPCQLVQAVTGLRFLLEEEGLHANNIILGGDSAGGHLTVSLLSHILYPSPYAPPIDLRSYQFKAMVLISPWLKMPEESSIEEVPQKPNDYLTPERVVKLAKMFSPALNEVWGNPYEAEDTVAVWKRFCLGGDELPICRKAILTVGTSETLLDSCLGFGRDLLRCESVYVDAKTDFDRIKEMDFVLAIIPGETHVQPGLDCALGYHDGRTLKAILAFLDAC